MLAYSPEGFPIYKPGGEVLRQFMLDRSHVSIIKGPIGSGTSSACMMKIWKFAMEQRPSADGIRRSSWDIVRNTYPELEKTTTVTWLDWFPEDLFGSMIRSKPMSHLIRVGDVQLQVDFIALNDLSDIKSLRSRDKTGVYFNEVNYQLREIFMEAESRTGRFPAKKHGGSNWHGVIADYNAADETHWLPQMLGEAPLPDEMSDAEKALMAWPENWKHFTQPEALIEIFGPDGTTVIDYVDNPAAENRENLIDGYYEEKRQGKTKAWIDSHLMNRTVFFSQGDPVWGNFKSAYHLSASRMPYVRGRAVTVSCDFGFARPCAIISQEVGDKIQIQYEVRSYGGGAVLFAPKLKRFLEQNYPGASIQFTGDPKGGDNAQTGERTSFQIFASYGMIVRPPSSLRNNKLSQRLESVSSALQTNRILVDGEGCPTLKLALMGKYRLYKTDVGDPEPFKDKYSDVSDCLQYLCLFMGEGRRMINLDPIGAMRAMRVAVSKSYRRIGA